MDEPPVSFLLVCIEKAQMQKEPNERRDPKQPDGSHQSHFYFGGVIPVRGSGHGGEGKWEGKASGF